MSDTVIQVENLSKKYIIGHQQQERYTALRDVMANGAKSLGQRLLKPWGKQSANPAYEEFWALKDVSFEVKQGDRIGIIGRNGAGKSTLLKILSRITEPTTGRIRIKGRVASLLEVGTGFHPELTGRENIYLNGAILGMSKAEIKRKFDEIVDFAGIEKFLDTPVKRYSSGMYVRLAFAVAAHLEPEILVVDEVLAVGDTQFQKKCLGKMENVSQQGRTVLFVSHNMNVIESLCNKGIYLKNGKIFCIDSIEKVIISYLSLSKNFKTNNPSILFKNTNPNEKKFEIIQVSILDENLNSKPTVKTWEYVRIRVNYCSPKAISKGSIFLEIHSIYGAKLIQYSTQPLSGLQLSLTPGEAYADCIIPRLPLASGEYRLTVGLAIPMVKYLCLQENIDFLRVKEADIYKSGFPPDQQRTPVVVEHYWEVSQCCH
ncbi:MAG: ABC transporter ATP-binding protein [Coleofasciculus chthonoplastes F3-SA18-01]|uniref:ABC transporter ATP-binding protein n=1 Tax=Coleofasciculus chthonoplastes TaxID=64178 RepID=UPI0032F33690